jgi:hypothetical protein
MIPRGGLKDRRDLVLSYTKAEFQNFITGAKRGEFDDLLSSVAQGFA